MTAGHTTNLPTGWTTGKCKACGAPYVVHELMNVCSPAVNNCTYCGTPKYSEEVIARAINALALPVL